MYTLCAIVQRLNHLAKSLSNFSYVVLLHVAFMCRVCNSGNWKQKLATGKIVLCFYTPGLVYEMAQEAVKTAKGLGLIFAEPLTKPIADVEDAIPTLHVDISQGTIIGNYLTESPK